MYTLKQNGEVIGYVQIDPDTIAQGMEVRNRWCLAMLFVVREHQGHGHARELMTTVCRAADEEHAELFLGVDPPHSSPMTSRALRSFYRKFGFVSLRKNINFMKRKAR